jgi:hypothetical protein
MDLVPINAFGRTLVQPSVANRDTVGVRPVNDPREAQIPASPLAAKNAADLRQANGPRQSSSSGDTREKENEGSGDVRGKGRAGAHHSRQPLDENGEGPGSQIDLTV